MWKELFVITAICMAIYSLYNFSFVLIKKAIYISKVSKPIYRFGGRIKIYPMVGMAMLFFSFIKFKKDFQLQEGFNAVEIKMSIIGFLRKTGVFSDFALAMFFIFLLINLILSIYIKPVMYDEGIICEDGSFLPWDKIKSITTIKSQFKNKRYILISTTNDKIMQLSVESSESNKVKEIIFNKSGIVNKEIVTGYF